MFPRIHEPSPGMAVRLGEKCIDYATLANACMGFCSAVAEAGLGAGDRVGVWAHPELETILGFVSAFMAGLTAVPLNPGMGDKELSHILGDAKPLAIFSAFPERDQLRSPDVPVRGFDFAANSQCGPPGFSAREEHEPALIVYTSGTTGAPKGAILSAANIATSLDGLAEAWGLSERDTIVHGLPLFHVHGLLIGLFGALRAGACLHFIPLFSPEEVAAALEGAPSSVLYAVPTMYHRLADAAEKRAAVREGLSSARLLISGSAALPAREYARLEALTGKRPCERYGLSETLINTAVRSDDERRQGYVGRALPGIEICLMDDSRQPMDDHDDKTIGEIAVRGRNVFAGYLNNEAATSKVRDAQGWFYTGDLGTLSPEGNLRIVGRKATDLIKTGGFKVGAGEVEGALLDHPGVAEAAVIGVEDPDLGERIVAFVVPRSGAHDVAEQTLIDFVSQSLARHKRPRVVHFVSNLPRNAMGKVIKAKLREGPGSSA